MAQESIDTGHTFPPQHPLQSFTHVQNVCPQHKGHMKFLKIECHNGLILTQSYSLMLATPDAFTHIRQKEKMGEGKREK